MKFSIVIPVYNVAPYLRECLDSVLAQTFTDWEAICVDDGSTDGSGEILNEYAVKDKRFRVFHQANAGVSAARNAALDVVKREYVCFVDADDYLGSGWLRNFYEASKGADFILSGISIASSIIYVAGKQSQEITGVRIAKYKLMEKTFVLTRCFKVKLIQENHVRFPIKISFSEDAIFILRSLLFAKTFAIAKGCGYYYRNVSSSASKKIHQYGVYVSVARHLKYLMKAINERFNIPEEYRMEWLGRSYVGHMRLALISSYIKGSNLIVRNRLIRVIQYNSKLVKCYMRNFSLIRRSWMIVYLNFPAYIVDKIIRLSPRRLG